MAQISKYDIQYDEVIYLIKIYGAFFTMIIGIILQHTYEWSDKNPFIAVLAPVNSSVFQHLKLLFTPYMLWVLVEYEHYGQYEKNFIPIKAVSLFAGMFIIVLLLNLSVKALRRNVCRIGMAAFVIATLTAFGLDYYLTASNLRVLPAANLSGSLLLFLIALAMSVFTFYPPDHPLFSDHFRSSN